MVLCLFGLTVEPGTQDELQGSEPGGQQVVSRSPVCTSFLLASFSKHFEGEGPKGGTLALLPNAVREGEDRGSEE